MTTTSLVSRILVFFSGPGSGGLQVAQGILKSTQLKR